ncbi:hypothetical protein QCA50_008905 [Cerrena zonata]|uniref:Uncharacterized protein n=1 Tax=Cerrena zonata TaxID=2478898 RepID=A0AAW0G7T1_9APHY
MAICYCDLSVGHAISEVQVAPLDSQMDANGEDEETPAEDANGNDIIELLSSDEESDIVYDDFDQDEEDEGEGDQ